MAKCPIYKIGGGIDIDGLTAAPSDVLASKTFMGDGNYEVQTGSMIERGTPNIVLPVNNSYKLPEGHYSGGKLYQSIPTLEEQMVELGPNPTTIQTKEKYMTGNVIVYPATNLTSSNIKKGVRIQVGNEIIEGSWEGYINTDPFTPFYYGSFNGIQSITAFKYMLYDSVGVVTLPKDRIQVYVKNNTYYTTIVFNEPIDITHKSRLTVRAEFTGDDLINGYAMLYRNRVTDYYYNNASSTNLKLNPALGEDLGSVSLRGNGGDYVINLSGKSGNVYVYLSFISPATTSNVYMVRFE